MTNIFRTTITTGVALCLLITTLGLVPLAAAECTLDACVSLGWTDDHWESSHWSSALVSGQGTLSAPGLQITCFFGPGDDCSIRGESIRACAAATATTRTITGAYASAQRDNGNECDSIHTEILDPAREQAKMTKLFVDRLVP